MTKSAPPAPVGPTSAPPKFDKQPPIRMPSQRQPRAVGTETDEPKEPPPFVNDQVVALARLLCTKKGDNPDAVRFGVRNYESQMELARSMMVAFFFIKKMVEEGTDGE